MRRFFEISGVPNRYNCVSIIRFNKFSKNTMFTSMLNPLVILLPVILFFVGSFSVFSKFLNQDAVILEEIWIN
jgi:hypothetical protein